MQIQEAQRVPKKTNSRRPKVKDKERILKAAREKPLSTRELPEDCRLISQQKLCRPEGIGRKYSK